MSKSIAVFLGPSLPQTQARALLNAVYYPPACRGDIYRIMSLGVETIILIDGVFHSTPSVWQRELFDAIEQGIQVLGASSMGALRAAELHEFGMVGYGTIFEWYRDGVIDGDDEVALLHSTQEENFRPLSEPLVNIRYTLLKAVEDHYLTNEQAQQLTEYTKQLYYPDRSYRQLLNSPVLKSWSSENLAKLEHYFRTKRIDLKRLDASRVLGYCANFKDKQQEPQKSKKYFSFFSSTSFSSTNKIWEYTSVLLSGFISSQGIVHGKEVLQEARKNSSLLATIYQTTSKHYFLLDWARHNCLCCSDDYINSYIEQWEQEREIDCNQNWLQANGLTYIKYRMLLEERALVDWITKKGPNHFGLNWNFQLALQEELQLTGNTVKPAFQESRGIWHKCKQNNQGDSALLVIDSKSSDIESADMWFKLSQRCFLLDWARLNGVSCPSDYLNNYIEQWEKGHSIVNFTNCLETNSLNFNFHKTLLTKIALIEWIVEQGPSYFGFMWNFEMVLLRELQITGKVAQLIENKNA
ncbi:MAG: TfuA-like protein [Xenococcaceae cyanobacterium MO_207.B15]|nr:TfuA-like protein [Xenococcaceae cyanobacterium MO_207.B15]